MHKVLALYTKSSMMACNDNLLISKQRIDTYTLHSRTAAGSVQFGPARAREESSN